MNQIEQLYSEFNACSLKDYCRKQIDMIEMITKELDFYKRLAERNHKANLMPCPKCGYKQAEIKAK